MQFPVSKSPDQIMDFSSSLLRFPEVYTGLRLTSTLQPRKQGKCSQTLLQNLSLGGSGQFSSPLCAPAQYNTKCTTSHPNTPIKLLTPLSQSILFKKRVQKAWLVSSFMDLNLWVCKSNMFNCGSQNTPFYREMDGR